MSSLSTLLNDNPSETDKNNNNLIDIDNLNSNVKVSTINENQDNVSNVQRNKFLIVKLNELKSNENFNENDKKKIISSKNLPPTTLPLTSMQSNKSLNELNRKDKTNKNKLSFQWNFDDNNANDDDLNTPIILQEEFSSSFEEDDERDVFDGEMLTNFFNDNSNMNNNDYREMEGQDTITSLSNNIYKRQLEKIKRKASLRKSSINSNSSSISSLNQNSNMNLSIKSTSLSGSSYTKGSSNQPLQSSPNTPIMSIKNIFKSQESLASKNISSFFKSNTPKNSIESQNLLSSNLKKQLKRNRSSKLFLNTENKQNLVADVLIGSATNPSVANVRDSTLQVNTTLGSKQEQMFDAIKEVIESKTLNLDKQFIDNVVNIVQMQEMHLKKKKDIARGCCFLAQIVVFIFILIMSIFFIKIVGGHLKEIQEKSISKKIRISNFNLNTSISTPADELFFFNSNYNSSSFEDSVTTF